MTSKDSFQRNTRRRQFRMKGPLLAKQFFRERNNPPDAAREFAVRLFHDFLLQKKLRLSKVEPLHINELLESPSLLQLARRTRQRYRYYLFTYLDWLFDKGKIGFDPQSVRLHQENDHPLPNETQRFLCSLTTLKPQSLGIYRTVLCSFYRWLDQQHGKLNTLTHLQMTDWFNQNIQRELKAVTRLRYMIYLRVYLRWCHEQNLLGTDPDNLIRPSDMPPVPSYLPRPLPPDLDRELRDKLSKSPDIYQQGLLLMRNTGLRIGELMALDFHCIHTDFQQHHFIKVPLGKLNNERLVPLDDLTLQLIVQLQNSGPNDRKWLLQRPCGKQTRYYHFQAALERACKGLEIKDHVTTHRLRHTFATSLLNGGMSMVGVMRLLGHRYIRTTFRYAEITQDTVVKDYFKAIAEIEKQYATPSIKSTIPDGEPEPIKLLSDVARWLNRTMVDEKLQKSLLPSLIKRITYLQQQIHNLNLPR